MAYNMGQKKKKKSSSRKPIPPAKGRSKQSQGKAPKPPRVSDSGIVLDTKMSHPDPATRGVMSGVGTVASFANAPAVGIPLAGSAAIMDTREARQAKQDLVNQGQMTDAYTSQPFSGKYLRSGPEARSAWDATYDDPRRAMLDKHINPDTGKPFADLMKEHRYLEKVSAGERSRHPVRQQYHDLLMEDTPKARAHKKAMQNRTADFDRKTARALASTGNLAVSGLSGGMARIPNDAAFKMTSTGLGFANPLARGVMPYAVGQGVQEGENLLVDKAIVPMAMGSIGAIPDEPKKPQYTPTLRSNIAAAGPTSRFPMGGSKF